MPFLRHMSLLLSMLVALSFQTYVLVSLCTTLSRAAPLFYFYLNDAVFLHYFYSVSVLRCCRYCLFVSSLTSKFALCVVLYVISNIFLYLVNFIVSYSLEYDFSGSTTVLLLLVVSSMGFFFSIISGLLYSNLLMLMLLCT